MTVPDQPLVIKSLKPDDWPERLYGGKAIVRFPSGVESGSWYNRPDADVEKTRDYHADLGNEDQDFAQGQLDDALAALAAWEARK